MEDFGDGYGGYCCTTDLDGKEFILSQCFTDGTQGVGDAIRNLRHQMQTIPTIQFRWMTLRMGCEAELKGMRLTAKTPPATVIIKKELGVRIGMSKLKTLEAFNCLLGLLALPHETIFDGGE